MSSLPGRRKATGSASFFAEWTAADAASGPAKTFVDVDISTSRRAIRRAERRSELWSRTARLRRGGLAVGLAGASIATAAVVLHGSPATADPSAQTWHRLRMCESSNNYRINTGNGYYGAYQFDLSTWRSVGGSGYPNQASPAEQDARALILYRMRGWQPWTCASILGLRPDSDAGSGYIGDIHIGSGGSTGSGSSTGSGGSGGSSGGVPAFPGSRSYRYGDWNDTIKRFQNEMHSRGYFPAGTGQYGPLTLAMVKQLQRLNGLTPSGLLGPLTWRLAWTGKYTAPSGTPTTGATPGTPPRHHGAPAFPANRTYRYGDWNNTIKRFQNRMHARGYFPVGTGQYGPLTVAMVKQLQRSNGIPASGVLGRRTWRLAWTGRYTPPRSGSGHSRKTAPPFPGRRSYTLGDWNAQIKRFQNRMHARGYFPAGTGQYGPLTLAMVKQLQRLNGLTPSGLLGPKTWRLAWTGRYHRP
jgi:resuscitation-promoting factor RpfA